MKLLRPDSIKETETRLNGTQICCYYLTNIIALHELGLISYMVYCSVEFKYYLPNLSVKMNGRVCFTICQIS